MREYKEMSIDLILESDNVRRSFSQEKLEELTGSVQERGILKPLLVRPDGEGFRLIDGWRRLSAAKKAKFQTVPVRVRNIDGDQAEVEMIVANLHHEDVTPLDESAGYQRLLDKGRTIEEVAARVGKPKRYVHQLLALNRLIPDAQHLLAQDILPLHYALKLATVPPERQDRGLELCFRPLFGKDDRRREHLEPLAELTRWIEKSVRLDPRSEDTKVMLPELAEQVAAVEQEHDAAVLAVSTLHFHTDRSDPKPILAKSWKQAEGKHRCAHARPAVIALGEGQGTFLHVCIAKKTCHKHWGHPKAVAEDSSPVKAEADAAYKKQQERLEAQHREVRRWQTEIRPQAIKMLAERTAKVGWSRAILRVLVDTLGRDALVVDVLGTPEALPTHRYPQAVVVALAVRDSWTRDAFCRLAKRLGVRLDLKALDKATDAANGAKQLNSAPNAKSPAQARA